MQPLPKWVLPPTMPSVFESESFTAMEAVARLYGATKQLIEEYNEFAAALQKEVNNFSSSSAAEIDRFTKEIENRLACKFNDINAQIQAAKTGLTEFALKWLEENHPDALPVVTAADNGKIMMVSGGEWGPVIPAFTYDPDTETLTLNIL